MAVKKRKQAVVVVHGMGEQRPLQTLRDFVEAAYQRDLSLTPDDPRFRVDLDNGEQLNRVWIVPDDTTGSEVLRRITTTESLVGVRTDFYEFYWADIMSGTPLDRVTAWLWGLLLRSPFRVPRRTKIVLAWLLLWALTGLFVLLGYLIADPDAGPFHDWVTGAARLLNTFNPSLGWAFVAAGVALLGARLAVTRPVQRTGFKLPAALVAVGLVLLFVLPQPVAATGRFWAGMLAAAVALVTWMLIVPYVGDVVRYARATPNTVASRKQVRDRGLGLLRALHERKLTRRGSTPYYDRIVLVGHSLGAIIAYDLLLHLWEEIGPTHKHGTLPPAVVTALNAVDDPFVENTWNPDKNPELGGIQSFDLPAFRNMQADVYKALMNSGQGWLISDFVTLGSPLAHAEFLLTDSRDHLKRSFEERVFAASPPRPDLPNSSMLYGWGDRVFAHFAAPFAAVRWTNIFDESWFPLAGDAVSGSVRGVFGPGIEEHDVKMSHGRWLGPLGRFVTHTLYWSRAGGKSQPLGGHVARLRDALDIGRTTL
ncbi:MAG TPA: hypothetical protein VMW31_00685 [Devosiaceae bacterium]|nr:hypothetical protein [Devosiaceae bacterium]